MRALACALACAVSTASYGNLNQLESNSLIEIRDILRSDIPFIESATTDSANRLHSIEQSLETLPSNLNSIEHSTRGVWEALPSINSGISSSALSLSNISTKIESVISFLSNDKSERGYLFRIFDIIVSLYNDELHPFHKFIKDTFYPLVQSIKDSGLSVDFSTLSDAQMRNEFGMSRSFGQMLWDIAQSSSEIQMRMEGMDESLGLMAWRMRDLPKNLIHDEDGNITELGTLLTKQDEYYTWYKTQFLNNRIEPIKHGVTNISAISALMLKELQLIRTNTLHGIHIAITNSNNVLVNQAKDYKTESDKYKTSVDGQSAEVKGLENRESEFMSSLGDLYNPSAIPSDTLDNQGNALNAQLQALRDTIGYNTSADQCRLSITVPRLLNPFDDSITLLRGDEGLGFYDSNTLPSTVVNFLKFIRFGFLTLYIVLLIHLTIKVSGYVLKIWHSITSLFGEKVSPSLMI